MVAESSTAAVMKLVTKPASMPPAISGTTTRRMVRSLVGFVTSFITAAVELSATILLVSADSQAPMSYGIYLYMQSVAGRGPGAALGVLAIAVVALGTYLSHLVVERTGSRLAPRVIDETLPPLPAVGNNSRTAS